MNKKISTIKIILDFKYMFFLTFESYSSLNDIHLFIGTNI